MKTYAIEREFGSGGRAIGKKIAIKDRQREQCFNFWTEKKWKDVNNYDIVLDTAKFDIADCEKQLLEM